MRKREQKIRPIHKIKNPTRDEPARVKKVLENKDQTLPFKFAKAIN